MADKLNVATIYQVNQASYASLPEITRNEFDRAGIYDFWRGVGNTFYMLLNNELHYYTVVMDRGFGEETIEDVLYEILDSLGKIKGIEVIEKDHIEFWVQNRETNQVNAFMFFPYDKGVIEI